MADRLNRSHDSYPYHVESVIPSPEVVAAVLREHTVWVSQDGTEHSVGSMHIDHLANAAHLCLTWADRFGVPMDEERRAMCQNVRDEIIRRRISEVGR